MDDGKSNTAERLFRVTVILHKAKSNEELQQTSQNLGETFCETAYTMSRGEDNQSREHALAHRV